MAAASIDRVIFPFRGAELGGSHVAAFTLGTSLRAQGGIDCVVVCPDDTMISREARARGFGTVASGEAPTGRNNLATDVTRMHQRALVLARAGAGSGRAVVHCSDINTLRAWSHAAKQAGAAVIYHHHALNRLWWPPHRVSLKHAHAIVCVSDATLAAARRIRADAVKELNPFDLDLAYDRAAARRAILREYGWPDGARLVGWVGNFWRRKRPVTFLQTAAWLADRDPSLRFVMFGRTGDYSAMDLRVFAAQMDLDDRLALPGFRQPAEANIAGLDLLLAPARSEPFGRTLVEAQLLGTPIVATAGAGHTEIIERWGGGRLLAADAGPAAIGQACRDALAAPGALTLPPDRRAAIAGDLSSAAHALRMLEIYNAALQRAAGRRAGQPAHEPHVHP